MSAVGPVRGSSDGSCPGNPGQLPLRGPRPSPPTRAKSSRRRKVRDRIGLELAAALPHTCLYLYMHVLMRALSHPNRSTDWSPPQRPSAACNALSPPACCRRRSHRRRPSARPLCCRWFSLTVTRALRPVGPRGPLVGSWARARWPGYDRAVAHSHSWCRRYVWHDRCGRRCTSRRILPIRGDL